MGFRGEETCISAQEIGQTLFKFVEDLVLSIKKGESMGFIWNLKCVWNFMNS